MAIKTGSSGEMMIVLRMKDDGSAVVEKFADSSEKSAKKSSKAFDDFTSGAGINFKSFATYAGIAAAGAIAIGVAMVKAQIDIADATIKTADKLGTTAEAVSALNYVASLADVSAQELANSLQFMNRNLSDAAKGTGEARFALKDLGLSAKDLKDLKPEDAMLKIAEALEKIPSQADRAAIAADIFNDRTGKMLNVLKGGPEAIRATMAEAQRFGQVISTETARAAEQFNDNVTRLKANLTGMANSIMQTVVPALVRMTDAMLGNESLDALGRTRAGLANLRVELAAIAEHQRTTFNFVEPGLVERIQKVDAEIDRVDQKIIAANRKLLDTQTAAAANAGGGGIDSRAQEEAEKKLAQERERLVKEVLEIHRGTLSQQIRAAEEYVERYNQLERARAINVIQSDQELAERRLELAAQYEAQLAELNKPDQSSVDRLKEELTARGVAIAESYQSEAEQLRLKKENELAILDEMELRGIELGMEYDVLREQIKTEHEARMSDIEARELEKRYGQAGRFAGAMQKLWKQGASGQLQVTQTLFGELAGLMQSKHKSMFDIGKKAALAQATLSMFSSIAAALETKPFFPLGLAMGAVATAKGIANISAIKSTEFGSSNATGTFSASPSSGLPASGGLSDVGPTSVPAPIAPIAPERTLNLFLDGTNVYSPENIRDRLLPAIKEAWGEGVRFNVSISY